MPMTLKEMRTVASQAGRVSIKPELKFSYKNENGSNFSVGKDQVDELFRNTMRSLCGYSEATGFLNEHEFERNAPTIYELMEVAIDEALPIRVRKQYETFCEFKQLREDERPIFYKRITEASKRRAKTFVTKAADAGKYETFRLAGRKYEAQLFNVGGAVEIAFQDFITGRFTLADMMDIMLEAMDDIILEQIELALKAGVVSLQTANKRVVNGFDETSMDELLAVADAYGEGTSNIFCTQEFAYKVVPQAQWVSDNMKDERWANGFFTHYKKHELFILKQSFKDETNSEKVIDPGYCWIMPNGAGKSGKMVKIATVGKTHSRSFDSTRNADWSMKFEMFKKMAICVMFDNNICVYVDTSLTFAQDDAASDYGL